MRKVEEMKMDLKGGCSDQMPLTCKRSDMLKVWSQVEKHVWNEKYPGEGRRTEVQPNVIISGIWCRYVFMGPKEEPMCLWCSSSCPSSTNMGFTSVVWNDLRVIGAAFTSSWGLTLIPPAGFRSAAPCWRVTLRVGRGHICLDCFSSLNADVTTLNMHLFNWCPLQQQTARLTYLHVPLVERNCGRSRQLEDKAFVLFKQKQWLLLFAYRAGKLDQITRGHCMLMPGDVTRPFDRPLSHHHCPKATTVFIISC